jgi:hypothetical protein
MRNALVKVKNALKESGILPSFKVRERLAATEELGKTFRVMEMRKSRGGGEVVSIIKKQNQS